MVFFLVFVNVIDGLSVEFQILKKIAVECNYH